MNALQQQAVTSSQRNTLQQMISSMQIAPDHIAYRPQQSIHQVQPQLNSSQQQQLQILLQQNAALRNQLVQLVVSSTAGTQNPSTQNQQQFDAEPLSRALQQQLFREA